MYSRFLALPKASFFLFGPRGTGKSSWVGHAIPEAVVVDLLEADTYTRLQAAPERLEGMVPADHKGWVVIDEVQKIPALLDEVHRLIEKRKWRFALTGSSARSLRRGGVNLLAGRARTLEMHPLTAAELGKDFDLAHAVRFGGLPSVWVEKDPADYLASYVRTYLEQEVRQEGLTRNLGGFARFLEAASFSQASVLNISGVARDCGVERKTVEQWFQALEDLLLAVRVPMFTRRAKRKVTAHPRFFLFDAGVYRTLRPKGPLDAAAEIDGPALETLVLNELRAANAYRKLGYDLSTWRTEGGAEVDFVLNGERGLHAIEVKRAPVVRTEDLAGLRLFGEDYPPAKRWLLYGGKKRLRLDGVECVPLATGLVAMTEEL
ncbi:MAG: AAA family ATPase [Planctomycetota bacterium]